jgi:hypothetical protein
VRAAASCDSISGTRSAGWSTGVIDEQSQYQYVVAAQPSGSLAYFAYPQLLRRGRRWKRLEQRRANVRVSRLRVSLKSVTLIARVRRRATDQKLNRNARSRVRIRRTDSANLGSRRRSKRRATLSGEPGRPRGGSGSRAIGPEAPHPRLGGFAALIADDRAPDRGVDPVVLHAGGRGSPRRSRHRETALAGTRTGGLRGAKRETGVGPLACLLSVDTEHGRSYFPRRSSSEHSECHSRRP